MKKIFLLTLTIFTTFIISGCFPFHHHHGGPGHGMHR
jgi:hypothetical protein